MQRREFVQSAGKGLIASSLLTLSAPHLFAMAAAQNASITAVQVVDRIRKNLGTAWKDSESDVFCAGDPDTRITGIATSYTASIGMLRRAAAAGKNMIIVREHPFYTHSKSPYSKPVPEEQLAKDPACAAKRTIIKENNLVVWRFSENWQAREVDGQLLGLARALKWEKHHTPLGTSGKQPFHKGDSYFVIPKTTLKELAADLSGRLNIRGLRMIGDPSIPVQKVALSTGLISVPELGHLLKEPAVDAVVIGEPVEWEASPYFQDLVASGQKKGMIIIGQAVSQDPGSGEVARWLGTVIPEIPADWIPVGDPFWMLKPIGRA